MNKTILVSLFAALPVLAQQETPATKDVPMPPNAPQARHWGAAGEMPQRPDRKDFHKKMLEKFDTDQDGQLSDTEKEAMKAEMQKHRAEKHNRPDVQGNRRPNPEGFQKKMLEKFDTDQDGQLSDTEKEAMKAKIQKHRAEKHNRPDVQGNRRPNPEDFQKKMLEKFDTDQDGQLSDTEKEAMKAEMQKHREKRHHGNRGQREPRPGKAGHAPAASEL